MLEDLFQIRPYAQVRDVIGDGRKSMRHALRDDDNVARLYFIGSCIPPLCRCRTGRSELLSLRLSGAERLPLTMVPPMIRVALPDMTT